MNCVYNKFPEGIDAIGLGSYFENVAVEIYKNYEENGVILVVFPCVVKCIFVFFFGY